MLYRPIVFLAYLIIFSSTLVRAQNIIEAEYFIDVDPGVGNGQPLPISQEGDSIIFDGNISMQGISQGEHTLVFRLKTDDGLWSLGNYTRFFIEEEIPAQNEVHIAKVEYFVDTDPGVGLGASFSSTEDSTYAKIEAVLDTENLEAGPHQLIARAQLSDGTWSLGNYASFYVEDSYTPFERNKSKITKVEYFIDGPDPGYHQAVALLPTIPDFEVSVSDTLLMSADTADLGRHAVLARVLTENNEWSLTGLGEYDYCSPEGVLGGFSAIVDNNTFTFTDSSKYAVEYIWDMNNGDSLFEAEPVYTYPEGGNYNVCQTVYSFCDTTITCKSFFLPTPRVKKRLDDLYIPEDSGPLLIESDLNNVFEDLDGDLLSFSVVSNQPEVLASITASSLTVESTDDYDGFARVIVAAEGGGIFAYDTIDVEVFPVNDVPIAVNRFNDVLWDEDSGPRIITRFLSREITDVEDTRLEFNVYADTSGLMPQIQTDSLVIYLAEHFNGEGNVYIEATDDSAATSIFSFKVSLIPLADPPTLLKNFNDITIFEDSGPVLVSPELSSHFSDPDGDEVSIEVMPLQEFVSTQIINDSLWALISPDTEGTANIIVSATDGALFTRDTFNINILPENDAPKFIVNGQLEICAEQTLEINLKNLVSDSDGFFDDIRFSLSVNEISQPSLLASDLTYSIDEQGILQFTSSSKEAAQVSLILNATDLQNATNDTTLVFDVLGASIIQIGDTLYANSGNSYQWYKGGTAIIGATQDKYVPTKKDFYQVAVNHGNCEVFSEPFQVTGTEIDNFINQVHVYPNPTSNSTSMELQGNFFGKIDCSITDIQGKVIWQNQFTKTNFRSSHLIDLTSCSAGFYILRVKVKDISISKKLYKQ